MVSLVTSVLHNVLTPVKDVTMSMVYVTEDVIQAGKGTIVEIIVQIICTEKIVVSHVGIALPESNVII